MANRPDEIPPVVGECGCSCCCGDTGPWRKLAWMPLCDYCYGMYLRGRHDAKVRR